MGNSAEETCCHQAKQLLQKLGVGGQDFKRQVSNEEVKVRSRLDDYRSRGLVLYARFIMSPRSTSKAAAMRTTVSKDGRRSPRST